ncbi:cilia- and flagella-associated protein 36 isoform X2 [Rhinoderma darwinii]|uniref:cilia- and flagella-associated protein 36 isoform X2 n=1 Tax=Rhinoderma darwinii TaxID=43563 RepID=UPI003F6717D4
MADDVEWVLESVLAYLSCPAWTAPVCGFIEHKCSVFDDEEENKLSYTDIHNEYKELVEKLIQEHLTEMGISEEQFQQACLSSIAHSPDIKNMLQSVVAVEDFVVFKEMMLQKNIELQIQAIQIIQQKNGDLPECLKNGADFISDLEQQEIKMITEALRISREEYEQEQLRRKERSEANVNKNLPKYSTHDKVTTPETDTGVSKIRADSVRRANAVYYVLLHLKDMHPFCWLEDYQMTFKISNPKLKYSNPKIKEQVKPLQAKKQSLKEELPYKPPSVRFKEHSSTEAAEAWMEQARKEAGIQGTLTSLTQTEKEQLRERAEYLKQKRAELLARKGDSKKEILNSEENTEKASCSRQQNEMTEEELKNLQKRKQLAEKLKEEVINK